MKKLKIANIQLLCIIGLLGLIVYNLMPVSNYKEEKIFDGLVIQLPESRKILQYQEDRRELEALLITMERIEDRGLSKQITNLNKEVRQKLQERPKLTESNFQEWRKVQIDAIDSLRKKIPIFRKSELENLEENLPNFFETKYYDELDDEIQLSQLQHINRILNHYILSKMGMPYCEGYFMIYLVSDKIIRNNQKHTFDLLYSGNPCEFDFPEIHKDVRINEDSTRLRGGKAIIKEKIIEKGIKRYEIEMEFIDYYIRGKEIKSDTTTIKENFEFEVQ